MYLLHRLTLVIALLNLALAANPAQWRSRSIYLVLTDRFARSDNSTTAPCNLSAGKYCGGSWEGLINKLDYIQGMGFTAVWISPITHQVDAQFGNEAFHGYWQDDLYSLNPHFGTGHDLKALSAALHQRGMYLMVDVVANHFGYATPRIQLPDARRVNYSSLNPFNSQKYFHRPCAINWYANPLDQNQVEVCWIGYNTAVELPDVATTRSDVREIFQTWIAELVSEYGIDGLRVDTVKNVEKDFWTGFNQAAGVFCMGEVSLADSGDFCDYQNYMDGLINYPLYYTIRDAFKGNASDQAMHNLLATIQDIKNRCSDTTLLGTFVENHDQPRISSMTPDITLAKNAIAFVILNDGIPIIYYGEEQHFHGGNDPYNREAMWLGGSSGGGSINRRANNTVPYNATDSTSANNSSAYSTTSPLYTLITSLNTFRSTVISLLGDSYLLYKAWPIYNDASTIAVRKGPDNAAVLAVFSNLGSGGGGYTLYVGRDGNSGLGSNVKVVEMLSCEIFQTDEGGGIEVAIVKGEPKVFFPLAKLHGTGICGY